MTLVMERGARVNSSRFGSNSFVFIGVWNFGSEPWRGLS